MKSYEKKEALRREIEMWGWILDGLHQGEKRTIEMYWRKEGRLLSTRPLCWHAIKAGEKKLIFELDCRFCPAELYRAEALFRHKAGLLTLNPTCRNEYARWEDWGCKKEAAESVIATIKITGTTSIRSG